MFTSLEVVKNNMDSLLYNENIYDFSTAADIILEYRGKLKNGKADDKEITLALGLLCMWIVGGPRKTERYRNDALKLRSRYILGIQSDNDRKEEFKSILKPPLKFLQAGPPIELTNLHEFFILDEGLTNEPETMRMKTM